MLRMRGEKQKNQFAHLDVPSGSSGVGGMDYDEDDHGDHSQWVDEPMSAADILSGAARLDSSYAGGEFQSLLGQNKRRRQKEHRTSRQDQTHLRNEGFEKQMDAMVRAYMKWDEGIGRRGYKDGVPQHAVSESEVQGSYRIQVVDCFEMYTHYAELRAGDQGIPAALLSQGLVPTAPFSPSTAFTVRTLELYRNVHLRSPSLALQPYIKALCDLQGIPYRRTYSDAFNNAYDLYLRITEEVEDLVLRALNRAERTWRLKNVCPACTYVLDGEAPLRFRMLVTMDGGNSLKRLARREIGKEVGEDLGPMRGVKDERAVSQRYYLTRREVDKWAKETAPMGDPLATSEAAAFEEIEGESSNPCASRWHNMSSEATAKMWGIFDETDMVQSGEQSKYPLATVNTLLETFGSQIGCGYDIGCKFSSTIARSPLAASAQKLQFTSLVGAFHGHAHNRLCQLSNLAAYVPGLGLEDLEGCERMFSKQQKIDQFFKHTDEYETMSNLSKFIVDNYKQGLEILEGQDELARLMQENKIASVDVFSAWLEEERTYLTGLTHEPVKETMEMDYYQHLVDYEASQAKLASVRATFLQHNPADVQPPGPGKRRLSPETQMRHAIEEDKKNLAAVIDLETKLGIEKRWVKGSVKWTAAAEMVSRRRYQRCLDQLESLIVSRMFELTKMNMSKT
ncbi:hypothetical protein DFP72DRAFT_1090863, partial [Ephemerocybe angulata]